MIAKEVISANKTLTMLLRGFVIVKVMLTIDSFKKVSFANEMLAIESRVFVFVRDMLANKLFTKLYMNYHN